MTDHRWDSLDPADKSFVDDVLRSGREELPDDPRMRAIEGRLGNAIEKEAPPSGWWSRSRIYPIVGLAVVGLAVRAGMTSKSTAAPSVVPPASTMTAVVPTATTIAPSIEPTPATAAVSVESLPTAAAPVPAKVATAHEAKPRAEAPATTADELAVLEEASRALDATPDKALALTDEHLNRFRSPKFAQERERLAIVALVRLGRREAAQKRADAFEAAFPESAHLTRIRELVRP